MEPSRYPTLAAATAGASKKEVGDSLVSSTLVNDNSNNTPTLPPRPPTPHPKSTPRSRLLSLPTSARFSRSVSLPDHPPYSPSDEISVFQFPLETPNCNQNSVIQTPRGSVIARNPNSRSNSFSAIDIQVEGSSLIVPVDYTNPDFGLLESRTPSYEWDHYSPEPEYFKVRKESTDPNILDSPFNPAPIHELFDINLFELEHVSMETEVSRLRTLRGNLLRRMDMFTIDDVTEELIHEVDPELALIHGMFDDYVNGVENLLKTHADSLNEATVTTYNNDITYITDEIKKHKKAILIAKKNVCPPPTQLSSYETKMLEYQLQSLELQRSAAARVQEDRDKKGELLATTKANEFTAETNVIGDMLMDEDWDTVDNITVSQAVRQVGTWQTQMNLIERKYTEFQNVAKEYTFATDKIEPIDNEYTRIQDLFYETK